MTNKQHNWLDMINRVIRHTTSTDNQPITDTIPAFATGILALAAKKAAIVQKAGKQEEEITGITKDKAAARILRLTGQANIAYQDKTNADGEFNIAEISPDDYDLEASLTGWQTYTENDVHFSPGSELSRSIVLEPEVVE